MYEHWKIKLESYLNDKFAAMRYSVIFEIKNDQRDGSRFGGDSNQMINFNGIYQYSLEDLKQVLEKTDILEEFALKLKNTFENTLLVPGTETSSIIMQYIKAISILRILDPSQVCLEIVSEPIKEFLRSRKDTLKCIIDIVINPENSELYNQLGQEYVQIPLKYSNAEEEKKSSKNFKAPNMQKPKEEKSTNIIEESNEVYISSDEDEEAARKWKPAPLNAKMTRYISTKFLKSDIISTLVNIYGSKDEFLKEYTKMLCERLLNSKSYSIDNETEKIELLKSRFGDSSLKYCDVMLRDIKESKKLVNDYASKFRDISHINQFSDDTLLKPANMDTIIISKDYWGLEKDDAQFTFPYTVLEPFDNFKKDYSEREKCREIDYLSNFGNVALTLTFDNGSFSFSVSPIHAAIISLFHDNEERLTDEYLAEKLAITKTLLEEKITFWVKKGVLIQEQKRSAIAEFMHKTNNITGDQAGIATYYYTPKELHKH